MIDQMVNFFQTQGIILIFTEWFASYLNLFLGLCTALFGIMVWRKNEREKIINEKQKIIEERKQTLAKVVEIDIRVNESYLKEWSAISELPGDDQKDMFSKEFKEIDDHKGRSIFVIINTLALVFHYYRRFDMPLDSHWVHNFKYTFNPKKRKVFVSAFLNYETEGKLDEDFVSYVKEIIKKHENNQDESVSKEKGEEVA